MKTSAILLLLVAATTALAQPIPEWTSPNSQGLYAQDIWITLRSNPLELRYFTEDATNIYIMDGLYSTNVAVTIFKPANCFSWMNLGYDITGDGINDLCMALSNGVWPPPPGSGIRFVNSTNGLIYCEFLNQGSNFYYYAGAEYSDIDNDGWNELVMTRSDTTLHVMNQITYQTNGIAQATSHNIDQLPSAFSLNQNYPNPFNPATNISYALAQSEPVEVQIFDPAGRLIRSFNPGVQTPGPHKWIWDGKNNNGSAVASGVYFYTLSSGSKTEAKKMIVLR